MEALYLLIPLSVLAVFGIIWVLWRAIDGGQFEDLDGPAHAILLDDDRPAKAPSHSAPVSVQVPENQGENSAL